MSDDTKCADASSCINNKIFRFANGTASSTTTATAYQIMPFRFVVNRIRPFPLFHVYPELSFII